MFDENEEYFNDAKYNLLPSVIDMCKENNIDSEITLEMIKKIYKYLSYQNNENQDIFIFTRQINFDLKIHNKHDCARVKIKIAIEYLQDIANIPIIANIKGYKIAKNKDEIIKFIEFLSIKKQGIQKKIEIMNKFVWI